MLNQMQFLKQYGLAIAIVIVALLLMLLLDPWLHLSQASFLLFFGAVTLSALYGGRGPGISATALAALCANYFFLEPQYRWTLDPASGLRMVIFILQGLLISLLVGSLRTAQEQTRKSYHQLQASEAEIIALNQTLRHRVNELQTLFEVIPIGIAIAEDPNCRVMRLNPAFSKLLQIPDTNASSFLLKFYRNGQELTGEDSPQQYAAKHGVELHDLEIDVLRADQTLLNLYGHAAPLFDEQGEPRGSVGAFMDISDRKRVEASLRQLMECSRVTGTEYFTTLVRTLSEVFQVRYAYVSELVPEHPERVRTIAAWVNGAPGENVEYDLKHTPCEQVIQQQTCFHPRQIAQLFPQDQLLAGLGIESYMGTPLRAPDGEVLGLLTLMHDQPLDPDLHPQALLEIFAGKTAAELQRERAIAELRQSEERYRAFVTHSTEGIWRFELAEPLPIDLPIPQQIDHAYQYGYLAECNQVMAEMYGFDSIEEILGAKLGDLLPPSDPRNLDYLQSFIRSGYRLRDAESYEVDRYGNAKYFTNNLIGIIQDKYLVRAWGNQRDISERRRIEAERVRSEAALRQSEERYRYLAESIPQLIWTANSAGELLDINQRWLDFTGLTPDQVRTEGWVAVVHPDDVPVLQHHWMIAQQQGKHYQAEGRMRRVDGVYRWHLHQAIPMKDAQGQVVKWFGSATDIEDQKRLEQQRDRLLQQEQAARAAAEQANRIKDEFLAVLSHELRSPLNPILGWAKLLRRGTLDATKTAQALEAIERNAKLQIQLIEDLLDVSRILRGKLNLNLVPVDLSSMIKAALETVSLAAEAKSIQVQSQLDSIGPVLGDAVRLQQVVWNLLSNAIKFTPEGGQVTVQLDTDPSVTATSRYAYAQLTVTDTGKGISPEFLPYVFEYFRQADATTTRQFGGLGLGLAIVRHLVELHGGTVQAESAGEDQGARFTVRLPLLREAIQAHDPPNINLPVPPRQPLQHLRVLLVDDEADARDMIAFILQEAGATVTVAQSGLEALESFSQSQPDVVISDIGMPEMDGYMLIRQLRSRWPEPGSKVPAIALTAYAGEVNQQQALAAGFQLHLAKPVEPEELVRAIVPLVANRQR